MSHRQRECIPPVCSSKLMVQNSRFASSRVIFGILEEPDLVLMILSPSSIWCNSHFFLMRNMLKYCTGTRGSIYGDHHREASRSAERWRDIARWYHHSWYSWAGEGWVSWYLDERRCCCKKAQPRTFPKLNKDKFIFM